MIQRGRSAVDPSRASKPVHEVRDSTSSHPARGVSRWGRWGSGGNRDGLLVVELTAEQCVDAHARPGIAARRSAVVSTDPRPILNWPPPGTMHRNRGVPRKMSGYLPGVGAIRRRQNGSVLRPHRVHRARQEFRRSGTDASPAGPTFLLIRSASLRRFGSNAFAVPSRRRLRRPVSRCRPTGVTMSMRACWNSYGLRWVQPGAGT
jgi:hypothetical protein